MDRRVSRLSSLSLSAAIGACTLSGCALTTRDTTLIYPPATSPGMVAVAHAATAPAPGAITIAVLPFVDRRLDTTQIGNVRNALGMKLAAIRTVNSVSVWARDAAKLELQRAGFNADTSTTAPDSALAMEGEILNANVDAYFKYGGEVQLLVRVKKGGREFLRNSYTGKGSAGMNWTATAKSFAQTLALALHDALKQMVADVGKAATSN